MRWRRPGGTRHLAALDVFTGCTPAQLDRVAQLVTRARFAAGTVLMRVDEIGREFLVVADGTVGVSGGTDDDVMPRSLLGPGDFVGELALLGGGTRTATVTALTAVTAYVCTPREFSALLDAAPSVRGRVLAAAFQRLAGATSVGGGSVPDGADDLP